MVNGRIVPAGKLKVIRAPTGRIGQQVGVKPSQEQIQSQQQVTQQQTISLADLEKQQEQTEEQFKQQAIKEIQAKINQEQAQIDSDAYAL